MEETCFELGLRGIRSVRFHSAGYRHARAGHRHLTRPSLFKHELILVEQGVLHLRIDGDSVDAGAGCAIVCRAGCRQEGHRESREPVSYFWFHFDGSLEELDTRAAGLLVRREAMLTHTHAHPGSIVLPRHFVASHPGELFELARPVASAVRWFEPEQSALLTALLCRVARAYAAPSPNGSDRNLRLVEQVRHYARGMLINPELAHLLSVRELARHFGRNPDYLNRRFRIAAGTSVAHDLVRLRVEEARRRLLQGRSVKEAAHLSGFANAKYLARQFGRFEGCSPAAFVKRHSVLPS